MKKRGEEQINGRSVLFLIGEKKFIEIYVKFLRVVECVVGIQCMDWCSSYLWYY